MRGFAETASDERPTAGHVLCERYEALRESALGAHADGFRHGLALLLGKGMATWIAAWRHAPPPPSAADPVDVRARRALAGGEQREVVRVLAGMALACVED